MIRRIDTDRWGYGYKPHTGDRYDLSSGGMIEVLLAVQTVDGWTLYVR